MNFVSGTCQIDQLVQLVQTRTMPETYDRDYIVPSADVTAYLTSLLRRTANHFPGGFPSIEVLPDGWGGMNLEWKAEKHFVRLVVPPFFLGHPSFVYRLGENEQRDMNVTAKTLSHLLVSLQEAASPEAAYRPTFAPADLSLA